MRLSIALLFSATLAAQIGTYPPTSGGGGSGTVGSGTAGQYAVYPSTGTSVGGSTALTVDSTNVNVVGKNLAMGTTVPPTGATAAVAGALYSPYTAATAYTIGALVTGSDTNTYRALVTTTGNDPTSDAGTHWELAVANANTSLSVPSRFATFGAAWNFLQNARIGQGYIVTIQFADGTYNFGTTRFALNHPDGSQIAILGNTGTRANVILNFTGPTVAWTGFVQKTWAFWEIYDGHNIGRIDGLTINGPGMGGTNPYGAIAISAFNGSSAKVGPSVTINNAYAGIAAFFNSTIWADGITVTGGGDGNVWAYGASSISCAGCTSTGASTFFAKSGFLADNFSYLFIPSATTSGSTCGVTLYTMSTAKLDSASIGEGLTFFGHSETEGYVGNPCATTAAGINMQLGAINWQNVTMAGSGYINMDYTATNTNAVAGFGVINQTGNDLHCFVGGAGQSTRTVFGQSGNIADCSTNGPKQLAFFTFDAKPFMIGTNNTLRETHSSTTGEVTETGTVFASLGTPSAGSRTWCPDCTVTTVAIPCTGSGSGAWAFRTSSSIWVCPF